MEEQHHIFTLEQRDEIKQIVSEALTEYFKNYGLLGKNIVVTMAIVLGSIVGVVVSLKTIFAWFGIFIIHGK